MNKTPQRSRQRRFKNISLRGVVLFLVLFAQLLHAGIAISDDVFHLDQGALKQATDQWGKEASSRLSAWEEMINSAKRSSDREKLEKVNTFINKTMTYAEDITIWGVKDYWATPLEFIGRGAGDCEDYAIAKYFSLRAMGIPDKKLRITYVKAMQLDKTHMVMTYVNNPGDEPLVLDNLDKSIKPASERQDLSPIFSFNGTELWMAQQRGQGESVDSSRLKPWRNLLKRMSENQP